MPPDLHFAALSSQPPASQSSSPGRVAVRSHNLHLATVRPAVVPVASRTRPAGPFAGAACGCRAAVPSAERARRGGERGGGLPAVTDTPGRSNGRPAPFPAPPPLISGCQTLSEFAHAISAALTLGPPRAHASCSRSPLVSLLFAL